MRRPGRQTGRLPATAPPTMHPLRIGYIMQNGAPDLATVSGPMLHVTAVVQGLRRAGHDVRTVRLAAPDVTCSDDLESWWTVPYGYSRSAAFRCIERPIRRLQHELRLPYANLFESLRFADACTRALRGRHILYERHGYLGYGGLLTARRLGIPLVVELNGNIVRELDEMDVPMSRTQRALGRWITKNTLRAADHVVVVSDALRQQVVRDFGVPPARVSTVINGVDLRLFMDTSQHVDVRAAYGVGAGPLVTFVGNFQPWHGVDVLVAAFAIVRARHPDARLVLVGNGGTRDAIAAQVAASPSAAAVVFTGRLPQEAVARVLHASDVLVAPYAYTHGDIVGTPLKVMEYMATGRAIVASTAPIHEIVEHGVTGIRVAPANAAALAEGIEGLLDDPAARTRLGQAARTRAQGYSWDNVVQRLLSIFRDVRSP